MRDQQTSRTEGNQGRTIVADRVGKAQHPWSVPLGPVEIDQCADPNRTGTKAARTVVRRKPHAASLTKGQIYRSVLIRGEPRKAVPGTGRRAYSVIGPAFLGQRRIGLGRK